VFYRPVGQYVLKVQLRATGTVSVEAWNDTLHTLLGRRMVPASNRTVTVSVPVANTTPSSVPVFSGTFGFRTNPLAAPTGQALEARVYLPAGTTASVYSVNLIRQP